MRLGRCRFHDLAIGSHEVVSMGDTFVLYSQIRSDYDFAIGVIVLRNDLPKLYPGLAHPIFWTEIK
jgi:hypothetical protein